MRALGVSSDREDETPACAAGPTIFDRVAEEVRRFPHLPPLQVAHRVLAGVPDEGWRGELLPLVERYCRERLRAGTLRVERNVFDQPRPLPQPTWSPAGRSFSPGEPIPSSQPILAAARPVVSVRGHLPPHLRPLMNEPLRFQYRGVRVDTTWWKATVEEHRLRLAMLTAAREGIDRTVAQTEEVLALLCRENANSLAELDARCEQ